MKSIFFTIFATLFLVACSKSSGGGGGGGPSTNNTDGIPPLQIGFSAACQGPALQSDIRNKTWTADNGSVALNMNFQGSEAMIEYSCSETRNGSAYFVSKAGLFDFTINDFRQSLLFIEKVRFEQEVEETGSKCKFSFMEVVDYAFMGNCLFLSDDKGNQIYLEAR